MKSALLLDLGNSRWKMAIAGLTAFDEPLTGGYDQLDILSGLLERWTCELGAAWVSSVVDEDLTAKVSAMLADTPGLVAHRVRSTDPMPDLVSGYRRPEQLGVDRLLAMVAVRAMTPRPFCVVDAGTAVTIDFVDAGGQHLGGFILPGEPLFRDCLLKNTSIPPDGDIEQGVVLGRDTSTAVALGARYSVAGIVERFTGVGTGLGDGSECEVYVGGGGAGNLMPLIDRPCIGVDHLVLRGLAVLARNGSD